MAEPTLKLRADALQWRAIEGEVVALDLHDSVYFGVNRTGAILWPALARGATRSELAQRLVDECAIPRAQAEQELDQFLSDLAAHGLLDPMVQ